MSIENIQPTPQPVRERPARVRRSNLRKPSPEDEEAALRPFIEPAGEIFPELEPPSQPTPPSVDTPAKHRRGPRIALGVLYSRVSPEDQTRTVEGWQALYAEMCERIGPVAAWVFFHIRVFRVVRESRSGSGKLGKWLRRGFVGLVVATGGYLWPTIESYLTRLVHSLPGH